MRRLFALSLADFCNKSVNHICGVINDDAGIWHSRLCHVNFGLMSRLSSMSLILNFTIVKGSKCHSCEQSKQPRKPHKAADVRPGAMGLLIDIECSRVRDSLWMSLTSLVTTRIGVELAAVQRKLPDCVVVGLQLYSARTFHVTLSPRIYKGGQGPPRNINT